MTLRHTAFTALFLLGFAEVGSAQQPGAQPAGVQPVAVRQQAGVDVGRLPINLQRIQRELAQQSTREREQRDGVNLRYLIDVFGQAPPIELFTPEDNLLNGPVPYGAPTHKEMIYMVTPEEFRSPAMDFSSLFRWLSNKSRK
jgi:hypothetical protein